MVASLLAVPMIFIAGGGVDLMLQERARSSLQNDLDRAVLAAASLTQKQTAEETVRGYLSKSDLTKDQLKIASSSALNTRVVTAEASYPMKTTFLSLMGIDTLDVKAWAKAEERKQQVEVSLVLDLSGSMSGARINAMRPAAKSFVRRLLRDETKDYTTVSLIPYAGQVSVGAKAFDALTHGSTARKHDKSSCFGNLDTTFSSKIEDFPKTEHVPQFSTWLAGTNKGFDPWNCPTEETSITYLSNDAELLASQVDGFHMFDGTATHIAMKWGLHLLDPAFRPYLKTMADYGGPAVDAKFSDRPVAFNDPNTLKVIVLMTDGEVVAQQRPKSGEPVNPQPTTSGTNVQKVSQDKAIDMMVAACDAARANGITIYTIGFDVNSSKPAFLQKLKSCASSASHYYDATSSNLDEAFQSIAGSIERVHLINS